MINALGEQALAFAMKLGLESLDAMHLATALTLPLEGLHFVTWDGQLHRAARSEGLTVVPVVLP